MIIGSEFSKKNRKFLEEIAKLSNGDIDYKIPVKDIGESSGFDRAEIKNMLEYLEELGYVKIETIGGPFLYGHVSVTRKGLDKASGTGT